MDDGALELGLTPKYDAKPSAPLQQIGPSSSGNPPQHRGPHQPTQQKPLRDPDAPKPVGLSRSVSRMGQHSMQMAGRTVSKVGQVVNKDRNKMLQNMQARRKMMETSLKLLESNPTRENIEKVQKLKTFVEKQLQEREQGHPPRFTTCVTVVQGILLVCMMVFSNIAPWGLGVQNSSKSVRIFVGETVQPVIVAENPFFGPDTATLVAWGSKWAPCMRNDQISINFEDSTTQAQDSFGCCINTNNECGMMSESDCSSFSSVFTSVGFQCANVTPSCNIILRPCCYGIFGQCLVLTEDQCSAISGSWNDKRELCGETDCLFEQCGMGYKYYQSNPFGYRNPNQFYRFTTAIFVHVGVIHFVMNAIGQYVLVSQVEFVAGFWRTLLMYVISGSCGFMFSALFTSDNLSNGASAAIYGMLGVETVDMFQTWQLIDNKLAQLVGLVIKLAFFLGVGTLPYIDNFAHVGGFLAGVVVGLCLLPYMVFGSFDEIRKKVVQILAVIMLLALVIGLLYEFYKSGTIVCPDCQYIDCVPYTKDICNYGSSSVGNSTN